MSNQIWVAVGNRNRPCSFHWRGDVLEAFFGGEWRPVADSGKRTKWGDKVFIFV